jgi:glycosyltransferase involved in cell wall biosynthesis
LPSVVIAAHNEAGVIDDCLRALQAQPVPDLEVIVVANGCSDRTVAVAARTGVTVIDRPEPGKPGALNAGEAVATTLPRIYLDADILVPEGGLPAILDTLATEPHPLAVVPRRRLNTTGRPWPVRSYLVINERLPAFQHGLFGRGLIALSAEGRARFDRFPEMIADDLFLDSQFTDAEKAIAERVQVTVEAPFTTRDLLRRLVRVRRGNAQMRAAAQAGQLRSPVRSADRWAWWRDVVRRDLRLVPAAVPYVALTLTAAVLARLRSPDRAGWGRDESTRRARPDGPGGAP